MVCWAVELELFCLHSMNLPKQSFLLPNYPIPCSSVDKVQVLSSVLSSTVTSVCPLKITQGVIFGIILFFILDASPLFHHISLHPLPVVSMYSSLAVSSNMDQANSNKMHTQL